MRTPSVYEYRVLVSGVPVESGGPLRSEEDAFQLAAMVAAGIGPRFAQDLRRPVQLVGPRVTIEQRRLSDSGQPAEGWSAYEPRSHT